MKAAVFSSLEHITLVDKPVPEIGSGEVLMKVEYCGLCGSDVHGYLKGMAMPVGTVLGHECAGVVERVGREIDLVVPGDRVWVRPGAPCGQCRWCRKGQYMYCPSGFDRALGLGPGYDGAFAEYVLIKYPRETLIKLPDNVSFQEAALIEPLSVALHAVRRSRFKIGDTAVVAGTGMIGLAVLQFLALGGAGRIIALETSATKAELARKLGADDVLNPMTENEGLKDKILELTGGVGADIVFECAGVPAALDKTIDYVSSGGQIMLIGLHEDKVPFDFWQALHREIDICGSLGFIDEPDYVMTFLAKKKIPCAELISDTVCLAEIEEKGFKRAIANPDIIKILVRP